MITKPYRPVVTMDELVAFNTSKPETYTKSPLLNAVMEAVAVVRPINCQKVAEYLELRPAALSCALEVETGLPFSAFLDEYRRCALLQLRAEYPEMTELQVVELLGFADDTSLWRFRKRLNIKDVDFPHK